MFRFQPKRNRLLPAGALAAALATVLISFAARAEEKNGEVVAEPLPDGAIAQCGSSQWRVGRDVNSLAFSRDGKLLVSASDDFIARIWNVSTGREQLQIRTWASKLTDVALSPDGNVLAAGSSHGVWLWDAHTGERLHLIENSHRWVAFSPDGKHVLSASQGTPVHTWDVETGKKVEGIDHKKPTGGLGFSPDGKWLSITEAHQVNLWNWETQQQVISLKVKAKELLEGRAVYVPGANRAAAVSSFGAAHVWDTSEGKVVADIREDDVVIQAVALSADGKHLYTGDGKGRLQVWDYNNGKAIATFDNHHVQINCLAISPDGKTLAAGGGGGSQRFDFSISLWNIEGDKLQPLTPGARPGPATGMDVSRDGKTIAMAHANEMLTVWDRQTGELRHKRKRASQVAHCGVAFSPDGKWLAAAGKPELLLWPMAEEGDAVQLDSGGGVPLRTVVFTADGKYVAGGSLSGQLFIWDVAARKLLHTIAAHEGQIWTMAASPAGTTIATGSFDRHTALWDAATGRQMGKWKTHSFFVRAIAFSADGTRMASVSGSRREIVIRETTTGEIAREMKTDWAMTSVAFCDGGRTLVTGHFHDRFKFWDLATGEMFHEWRPRPGPFTLGLVARPGGPSMVTALTDSTAVQWDLKPIMAKLPPLPRAVYTDEQLNKLWDALSGNGAPVADAAMWKLVAAGDKAAKFLRERLIGKPVKVDKAAVEKLLVELDDDAFVTREAAERKLRALGAAIAARLEKELNSTESAEVRVRVTRLLERITGTPGGFTPQQLQAARGIHTLACLGTPAALDTLQAVADAKPTPWRAARAQLVLDRMKPQEKK